MRQKNHSKSGMNKVGLILLFLSFLLIVLVLFNLEKSSEEGEDENRIPFLSLIPPSSIKSKPEALLEVKEDTVYEWIPKDMELLKKYQKRNEEVVGIITIPGTVLHHPVMQSPNRGEDFYLSHDLDLNHNFHGVPFLTLQSDLSRETGNNILYGHNIIWTEPKDVFCDLVYYENLDYYKDHPVIEMVTKEGTSKYLIFSYAIMDTSDPDAFIYWEDTFWEDDMSFHSYMSKMEERNWLDVNVPYNRFDAFLTISTCSKELAHSGTNRMVVMAKRMKVGEEYMQYVKNSSMRDNPMLPEKMRKR